MAAIAPTCVSGEPPAPRGDSVPDGVYNVTKREFYGDCGTTHNRGTIVVCGDAWGELMIVEPNDAGQVEADYIWSYSVQRQGKSYVLTPQCASDLDTTVVTVSATVSANELQLFYESTSTGAVAVETLQKVQ